MMSSSVRKPCVAGAFYEARPEALRKQIEWCFLHDLGPGKLPEAEAADLELFGLISPHAGYVYSGPVAAHAYYLLSRAERPETVIIVGPNHSGLGAPVAIVDSGEWETPLGRVPVDSECASLILEVSGVVEVDDSAHKYEHSIEVQLPFLQYVLGGFKLVPIAMLLQNYQVSRALGRALAEAANRFKALVIATTDFTHYEPQSAAEEKDRAAISEILKLDARGLYDVVVEKDISMCGYGPVMALIEAARAADCAKAELLKYATSGHVTGDTSSVVGYASIAIYRG